MAKAFALDVILKAIDHVSAPLKGIAGKVQSFGNTIKNVGGRLVTFGENSGLTRLGGSVLNLGKSIKGVSDGVGTMGARIAGLGAATGLGIAGITALGQAYADATGAIGDAAERTGASRQRFQELSFAAKLTGSSAETLEGALSKMNLAVGNANKGSKDLKEMFAGLKISLKNSNGTLKTTDQLFETFVDRISKIKDPSLQAQAAVKVFGKSAVELLPLIRGGKAGLAEMSAEAQRLGIVLSDSAVREGEEFGDTLDTLTMALKGVGNSIGTALVPQLNDLGKKLIETIVKYRPQIEAFATAFAENLPGNIEKVTNFLGDLYSGMQPVINAFDALSNTFGGANIVIGLFGLYIGGPLLVSLISLGGSLVSVALAAGGVFTTAMGFATTAARAFSTAISANPLGAFIVTVYAFAMAAYLIYKNWDSIADFFTEKWAKVKAAFSDGIINGMWNLFKEYNVVTLMMEGFNGLVKYLTGWDLGSILKEKITAAVTAIQSSLPDWAKSLLGLDGATVTVGATAPEQGRPMADLGQRSANAAANTPIGERAAAIGQQAAQQAGGTGRDDAVLVTVDLKNAPAGTSLTTRGTPGSKFETNIGYSMGAPVPK